MFVNLIFSDYLFRLLLIGDSGVGKSCLLLRFAVSCCVVEDMNSGFFSLFDTCLGTLSFYLSFFQAC